MASNIPIIEDAGSMKNGVWVPDWKAMTSQAKKLGAKTVKTRSGKVIYFDNNYNPTSVDENPQMKSGGWLDKYEQGGMVLKQKTEDNYFKKPNPNEAEVSTPPGYVGLGYDTTGRDYSPAWGGQFQGGGKLPTIFTDDSKKVKAYNDSLNLYKENFNQLHSEKLNYIPKFIKRIPFSTKNDKMYADGMYERNDTYDIRSQGEVYPEKIKPIYFDINQVEGKTQHSAYYKKPEQQYIYQEPKRLERTNYTPELIRAEKEFVKSPKIFSVNIPQQENTYRVDYIDPETGKGTYKDFPNEKMGSEFQRSIEGNRTGYYKNLQEGGELRQAQTGISFLPEQDPEMIYRNKFNTELNKEEKKEFNKWITKESKRRGRDILMDKGAYDVQGFWKSGDYKNIDEDNHGSDKWKKPNHPTFSNQSKYHGVDGFYGGNWTEEAGYQPSKQTAAMYSPDYYKWMFSREPNRPERLDNSRFESGANSPSPLYYAMGGSLPGAVGFTYARTGDIPSNGKYAKKTLASAQDGGWLDKYETPQAQEGNVFAKREPLRPARESVSIMRNIPGEGSSTTATTGQRKGDVRLDTEGMARFKTAETKDKQKRVAERKSAIAAKDKGKPFTLPTGESKKYEDMDWREKAYVSGKSLESKGRANEDDEAWYDDYINPINFVTDMAGGLATAPLEAREYDSNLPYVGAVLNPLLMGRVMGSGSINPLSKKFWTNEVSNKEFINNMALGVPGMAKSLANKVGQSMESGVLSKAYKLNPYAFKANPEAYYRMIGKEGYVDALESGVIRPPQTRKLYNSYTNKYDIEVPHPEFENAYYNKGFPLDIKYRDLTNNAGYEGPYMAEVSNDSKLFAPLDTRFQKDYTTYSNEHIPIANPNLKFYKEDWLKGYKEVPKPPVDFSKYLTQEEAVAARAKRLISQNDKPGWNEQLTPELEQRLSTAVERHDPASDYPGEKLGANTLGRTATEISKHANLKGIPLTEANKARVAAHETGHYYSNSPAEGEEWLKHLDLNELPYKTKVYLRGKGRTANYANEIRERAAQLKDYIAQKNRIPLNQDFVITQPMLNDAIKNYVKNTELDNAMSKMLGALKDKKGLLKTMNKYALGTVPAAIGVGANKKKQGGVIKDDMGYWNPENRGKVVEIDSPYITMEGVDEPLIGISDEGDKKYMLPGNNYKFKGKKVREYPVAKNGRRQEQKGLQNLDQLTNFTNYNKPQPGGWLNKYN